MLISNNSVLKEWFMRVNTHSNAFYTTFHRSKKNYIKQLHLFVK
jgi:hypothetical protein